MANLFLPRSFHPDFRLRGKKPVGPARIKAEYTDKLGFLEMFNAGPDLTHTSYPTLAGGATISGDPLHGQVVDLSGGNKYVDTGINPEFLDVTFFLVTKPSDVGFGVMANRTGTSTGFDITIAGSADASPGLVRARFEESFGSSNTQPNFTLDSVDQDDWVCVFCCHEVSNSSRVVAVARSGRVYTASLAAGTVSAMRTGSQNVYFGRRGSSYSNNIVSVGGWYHKAMTLEDMIAHARAFLHYDFLEPVSPFLIGIPSGAPSTQDLSPSGLASGEAFGSHTIATDASDISPSGIGSLESFGAVSLSIDIESGSVSSAEAFGTATIGLTAECTGISTAEALGTASIGLNISTTGISSEEAFGSHVAGFGLVTAPSSIESAENFGTAVIGGLFTIAPTAILTAENLGNTIVATVQSIAATSIPTGENVPSITVESSNTIAAESANTGELFGSVSLLGASGFSPSSIGSVEAFGTPSLEVFNNITMDGITPDEAIGNPTILAGGINILPESVVSGEEVSTSSIDTYESGNTGKTFRARKRRHF